VAGGAVGAAITGAFVCLVKLCRGARFGARTLICGSCAPPGGTAVGGDSDRACCGAVAPGGAARGPAFCADAAPTAATIAHTDPRRLNSAPTDLNTFPPGQHRPTAPTQFNSR